MFNLFRQKQGSINSITIPDFEWTKEKEDKEVIQWMNPERTMALSIHFFNAKPDLPSLKNIHEVRDFYRQQMIEPNGGLIQVDLAKLKGHQVISTLFKVPQKPSGMIYLAALTIPFRHSSYVIKIQAPEVGDTGIRETLIANRLMKEGKVGIDSNGYTNWSTDPYYSSFKQGTLMNKSEEVIYDNDFPNHPLTQARRLMTQIENEIQFQPEIEKLKQFSR